jgi:hypothetical protein
MSTRLAAALLATLALTAGMARAEEPSTAADSTLPSGSGAADAWEVNGIRLERAQVDRLADDMAQRTVTAVDRKVAGIDLADSQRARMLDIYRNVAIDVFDQVVDVIERSDLDEARKDEEVRRLVLAGQERSHTALQDVLDARQLELYSQGERQQIDAYKRRRWNRGGRRRRR